MRGPYCCRRCVCHTLVSPIQMSVALYSATYGIHSLAASVAVTSLVGFICLWGQISFCYFFVCVNDVNVEHRPLTCLSGVNATCPKPGAKGNLTECNKGRQVCLSGVRNNNNDYKHKIIIIIIIIILSTISRIINYNIKGNCTQKIFLFLSKSQRYRESFVFFACCTS